MTEAALAGQDRAEHARFSRRSLVLWALLVAAAIMAVWLSGGLPGAEEPRSGAGPRWWAAVCAPVVALLTILAVRRGWPDRLSWPALLGAGYLASAVWTVAFGLAGPWEIRPAAPDRAPPLPELTLTALQDLGAGPVLTPVLFSLAAASITPLVAVATRSVCDELTARRLVPVLVLAPYALIAGGNVESLAAVLGALMLTTAVLASQRTRPVALRVALSVLCGLLLGMAALFGYSAIWLAAGTLCVFFVRRRPLLNVATGLASLIPLLLAGVAGFDWPDGLLATARDSGSDRPGAAVLAVALLGLLLLGGPALVASIRNLRTTPGWPFLVGGAAVLVVTVGAGLSAGHITPGDWLPGLPWLLVACVAPTRQGGPAVPTPTSLLTVGALTAYAVAMVLYLTT